jgi:CoA:oxalate CoA-transferase
MADGTLSGYRVLDLTHFVAGPYMTRLLSGLGAEVIKVEKPRVGDILRNSCPFYQDIPGLERSLPFLYLNMGKKSITLDLQTAEGKSAMLELARKADMVVENFEPRVLPSLGLDYSVLSQVNPGLVMTSISNFGQDGPYRDYHASEIVEYALSGLMNMTGESDREPLKLGLNVAQMVAGQNAIVPALAALFRKECNGNGEYFDISIMEYCVGLMEFQLPMYMHVKHITKRSGRLNEKGHPWGALPCRDGWVALAATNKGYRMLAEMMGVPEMLDPKFSSTIGRLMNHDELDAYMMPWLLEHDKQEIFDMVGGNIPQTAAGMVLNVKEIVESPMLADLKYFIEIEHPATGKATYPGAPFMMSETPWKCKRAPLLGEHNNEIYGKLLDYSTDKIGQLRTAVVI